MGTLDFAFIDNGEHAYMEVSYAVAHSVSVNALNSAYSYYDGRNRVYYFEEDVDAPEVISAIRALGYRVDTYDIYDPTFDPRSLTPAKFA